MYYVLDLSVLFLNSDLLHINDHKVKVFFIAYLIHPFYISTYFIYDLI